MDPNRLKGIRRRIMKMLYARYQEDPLDMLTPETFLEDGISREELVPCMHYLHDRTLVEMMMGYRPPLFEAARITAKGIDLVENRHEFDRQFPPLPESHEGPLSHLPVLVERLVDEADFVSLDFEERKSLQRDIQFFRDEVARPQARWRAQAIRALLDWIRGHFEDPEEAPPSLREIAALLDRALE